MLILLATACFEARPSRGVIATFDNADGPELLDFPVPLRLGPAMIQDMGSAETLGAWDATGAPLALEVEAWDPDAESLVWVRVPRIAAGSTTDWIRVASGATTAAPGSVFGAFAGVWHLAPDEQTSFPDSSGHGRSARVLEPLAVDEGIAGPAAVFVDGAPAAVVDTSETLFQGWDAFTLELWILPEYGSDVAFEGGERGVITKDEGALTGGRLGRRGYEDPGKGTFQIDVRFGGQTHYGLGDVTDGAWSYVVATYDGAVYTLYIDGEPIFKAELVDTLADDASEPLVFGNRSRRPFLGRLDEVRVADVGRSAGWVAAQGRAVRGTFATLTAESP